jgi:hypothetical protein
MKPPLFGANWRMTMSDRKGEGSYDGTEQYQKAQHEFAKSGKVEKKAREAAEALDGEEGPELEKARKETAKVGK